MKQFVFEVKRIHGKHKHQSKTDVIKVAAKGFEQAVKRLKAAKCTIIRFIEEVQFQMWTTKDELENLRYDHLQVRS